MRIAIFSDTYAPEVNGVARTLKRYTDYLDKEGVAYQLFVPESSTPVPPVPHIQRFSSVPFILYPECRIALPNPIQIRQTLDDFQPSLLHITTPFNLGLFGLHYGKKHNIPMVASYHTNFDDYLEYYRLTLMENMIWKYMKWFHRPFEKIFVPSIDTKEKLNKKDFHPDIDIWSRGVDNTLFSPYKKTEGIRKKYHIKEKNILLYVGRIAPEKDIDVVLQTFHSLSVEVKENTHLLIVGDGPQKKELSERNSQVSNITFTGFLNGAELAQVYATSDLFIFPSCTETFGNVILEAQASGLPVLGANTGGVKHLIENGENGFLCAPKNMKGFTEKAELLLKNVDLQKEMGLKARQFAVLYSWDKVFEDLLVKCNRIENRGKISTIRSA